MEFKSQISNSSKETDAAYFDKTIWLEYSHNYLRNLPDSLKLTVEEPKNILKAYYKLLGVGTHDEYGWICEYSTVGMLTDRRRAVIQLFWRPDLLLQLLDYQNIYVQLYVADTLIYLDHNNKTNKENSSIELLTKEEWTKIDQLKNSNQIINTCGNAGSYKLYEKTTLELLSKKSISQIIKNYEMLKRMGYLK